MEQNNLGTARWLSPVVVAEKHPYSEGRIWVGRSPLPNDAYASEGSAIGFKDDRHVLLVGGNRSGKGATFIVPNLCLWPGSVLVLDPKGENAMLTAARRGRGGQGVIGMGQKTYVLDPYGQARGTEAYRASFNPLDELLDPSTGRPLPDTLDQVSLIVDAMVVESDSGEADPFWNNAARDVLKSLILHVLTDDGYAGYRNLVTVRRLLTLGDVEMYDWKRAKGDENIPSPEELLWRAVSTNPAFNGIVSGIGSRYLSDLQSNYKVYASIISNAVVHTSFIDSDGLRNSLFESDFRLADLKNDPKGISLFLCLPQRYMLTHYRWMRIVANLATAEMERVGYQPKSGHRVLFMLDEFATLRRLEAIESAVSYIAGFGVKMAFVLQSLDQLKRVYPNSWETFYANCALRMFMGVEDNFTKDYVSKAAGDTEVVLQNRTSTETETKGRTSTRGGSKTTTKGNTSGTNKGTSSGTSRGGSSGRNKGGSENSGENEGWSSGTTDGTSDGTSVTMEPAGFFARMFFSRQYTRRPETQISNGRSHGSSQGKSGGTSRGRGTSWGENEGTSWGNNEGSSSGTSESVSLSEAMGETWSVAESVTSAQSQGLNEARHKRPLIAPAEIGRYFARVEEPTHPAYPGLGLILKSGEDPTPVRRTNYFEDAAFEGLFTPHPDYPLLPRPAKPALIAAPAPVALPARADWSGLSALLPVVVWIAVLYQWVVLLLVAWDVKHTPLCIFCPPHPPTGLEQFLDIAIKPFPDSVLSNFISLFFEPSFPWLRAIKRVAILLAMDGAFIAVAHGVASRKRR